MAGRPIRIELRGLTHEREEAQRDLQETISALEDKILPQRAARRFVSRHDPGLVLTGMAAAGLAVGLIRDENPRLRAAGLVAAVAAGAAIYRLVRA
jgi:hypothetical protein